MYGMETSSGDAKSKKGTVIGASLGVLFGVAVVLSVGILIFRRRRRVTHKESILQSGMFQYSYELNDIDQLLSYPIHRPVLLVASRGRRTTA